MRINKLDTIFKTLEKPYHSCGAIRFSARQLIGLDAFAAQSTGGSGRWAGSGGWPGGGRGPERYLPAEQHLAAAG